MRHTYYRARVELALLGHGRRKERKEGILTQKGRAVKLLGRILLPAGLYFAKKIVCGGIWLSLGSCAV